MDDLDLGATLKGFSPGQRVFQRYSLQRVLGRGGMGVVWLARDETLARDVALKFLPEIVASDPTALDDLKREVRKAIELAHPHIVKTNDFVTDGRMAAVSMEFAPGGTLAQRRLEQPARVLTVEQLRPWLEQLVAALDYAHTHAELVHRDLKPSNLMLDSRDRLRVVDFGIAASISDSVSRVSKQAGASGTPVYMSPQQMMGEKPAVTDDIYSVGATLYELLTGKPPFHSGNILAQVQAKVPPTMAARRAEFGVTADPIPAAWESAVAACLAKDPADRPQSARALLARIGAPVAEVPAAAAPRTPPPAARPKPAGRHLLVAAALGLALVVAVGWWLTSRPPVEAKAPAVPAPQPVAIQSTPAPAPVPVPAPVAPAVPPAAPVVETGIQVSLAARSAFDQPWILPTAPARRSGDAAATVPVSGARLRIVDLARRYDGDARTLEFNAEMNRRAQQAQERLDARNAEGKQLVERYKEAVEMSKNAVLTSGARGEAEATARRLLEEITTLQREIDNFRQSTQQQLQQSVVARRGEILGAITAELARLGARAGADLLLDRSGPTREGHPAVVYAQAALELADDSASSPPPRVEVGVVDFTALVEGHPMTAESRAKLAEARARAESEVRRLEQEIAGLRAAGESSTVEQKESELRTFRSNVDASLVQRSRTLRDVLAEEVTVHVGREAESRGLTLVLDRGAVGGDGERLVLDAGGAPDLTDAVRARIAADRTGR